MIKLTFSARPTGNFAFENFPTFSSLLSSKKDFLLHMEAHRSPHEDTALTGLPSSSEFRQVRGESDDGFACLETLTNLTNAGILKRDSFRIQGLSPGDSWAWLHA